MEMSGNTREESHPNDTVVKSIDSSDSVINNKHVSYHVKDESSKFFGDKGSLSSVFSNSSSSITCNKCNQLHTQKKSLEYSLVDSTDSSPLNNSINICPKEDHLSVYERLKNQIPCYAVISSLLNITLLVSVCVIAIYSHLKIDFERTKTHGAALCVFDGNRETVCTRDSMHLQYLLHLIIMRSNTSMFTDYTQSAIAFSEIEDKKGLLTTPKTSKRQISNSSYIAVRDNHFLITKDYNYFISLQLVFRRESRMDTNGLVTAYLIRQNSKSNQHEILMSRTLPPVNSNQALQNIQFIGTFTLKSDDKITISVSKPNIVYGCKCCNQITVMKISS